VCFCFQIYDIAKVAIIDKPIWPNFSFKKIMKRKFLNNLINFWLSIEIWQIFLIDFWKFFFEKIIEILTQKFNFFQQCETFAHSC
jgi:hypothetical protein